MALKFLNILILNRLNLIRKATNIIDQNMEDIYLSVRINYSKKVAWTPKMIFLNQTHDPEYHSD